MPRLYAPRTCDSEKIPQNPHGSNNEYIHNIGDILHIWYIRTINVVIHQQSYIDQPAKKQYDKRTLYFVKKPWRKLIRMTMLNMIRVSLPI